MSVIPVTAVLPLVNKKYNALKAMNARPTDKVTQGSKLGYLAGTFPNGLTMVAGVAVSAKVRVHYRAESGALLDGGLVAEVQSGVDGTWLVSGLDPTKKYDVIGRLGTKNDVIMSNITPAV